MEFLQKIYQLLLGNAPVLFDQFSRRDIKKTEGKGINHIERT